MMKDFSFQTVARLFNLDTLAQPLKKKSLWMDGIFIWMRKLGYLNQEKKIKIFQEVKMNESPFSPKMGRL